MQAFSFALLIGFTMKLIWPPLLAAIEERQKRIAEGLASAERSQRDLAQAQEKVNDVIKEARAKANEIIEQAHSRGNQIIDQAKHEAVTEANRQKAAALADIHAAAHRARDDQVGRAAWRERVCRYVLISVVAGSFKKKKQN